MRLKDAIASLQLGRKKEVRIRQLCTPWSEEAQAGPDAVPLPEYPRPQFVRQEWRCLNGWWEYAVRAPGEPMGEADGRILVPFSPETVRSGVRNGEAEPANAQKSRPIAGNGPLKAGGAEPADASQGRPEARNASLKAGGALQPGEVLWYRRRVEAPKLSGGQRLLLHFGAVDERCTVWWNGRKAGSHRNGYLAFSFDVTEFVRPGENELLVCVRDDTDKGTACRGKQTLTPGGMYYHAQSGIWQTVWLETVPEEYLSYIRITPLLEEKAVEIELWFSGKAGSGRNYEGKAKTGKNYEGEARTGQNREGEARDGQNCEGQPAAEENISAQDCSGGTAGKGLEEHRIRDEGIRITLRDPGKEGRETSFVFRRKTGKSGSRKDSGERNSTERGSIERSSIERSGIKNSSGTDNGRKRSRRKVRIPVPEPRLWSPEDPALYSLRIEAGEDAVESYFAMRSFGVGTDREGRPCLTLNGEPYFFHGVLDQGYWPESLLTPPSDAALVHDITQMKELGFNMLRKHVKVEPARWYYHCDRIGMVVWQDMVNGGGPVSKLLETYLPTIFPALGNHLADDHYRLLSREDAGARRRFEKDLLRMIRQLYNFPCIGMWVPFNEGWGQFDALRITEKIKKEDPTRPVDHASGWFDQGGGDVRSVHNYFRPLEVEKDPRPFVLSEYGGANCGIAGHTMSTEVYGYHALTQAEFPQTFRELMQQIRDLAAQGLSGAVYTQLSDIEEETNGLLTYDRKARKI